MNTTNVRTGPAPIFQAIMIWGSLLAGQGMVVLVSQTAVGPNALTAPDQTLPASSLGHVNPMIFMIAAGAMLLVAALLPQLLLKQVKSTSYDFQNQDDIRNAMKKVLPIWIVRWAMLESVTLMGFVNSMLNNDPSAIYPYAAVAAFGFIVTFPTEAKLRAAVQP